MIFIDHEEYNEWLSGKDAAIPNKELGFWVKKAHQYVDRVTLNKADDAFIKRNKNVFLDIIFTLAEIMYEDFIIAKEIKYGENVSSESVGEYKVTYFSRSDRIVSNETAYYRIVEERLACTGALYAGGTACNNAYSCNRKKRKDPKCCDRL